MKAMKYTLTVLGLGFLIMACGKNGEPGADGQSIVGPAGESITGPAGSDGQDGQDAFAESEIINLSPSRDYDPSQFFPEAKSLSTGVIRVPSELPLVSGVAGTGWSTVKINDVSYCYQGNGVNNSDPGTKFVLKGAHNTSAECFAASLDSGASRQLTSFLDNIEVEAAVNGGGVSSAIRDFTEVEVELEYLELN